MHDKALAYVYAFKEINHPPDRVEWHPATVSLHFGEYEVDVHPTCVLLFRGTELVGDVSDAAVDDILGVML